MLLRTCFVRARPSHRGTATLRSSFLRPKNAPHVRTELNKACCPSVVETSTTTPCTAKPFAFQSWCNTNMMGQTCRLSTRFAKEACGLQVRIGIHVMSAICVICARLITQATREYHIGTHRVLEKWFTISVSVNRALCCSVKTNTPRGIEETTTCAHLFVQVRTPTPGTSLHVYVTLTVRPPMRCTFEIVVRYS